MTTQTNLSQEIIDFYEEEGYINRIMPPSEIHKIMEQHGNCCTTSQDKYLIVQSPDGEMENTTDWTLFDCFSFLGY